jgi:hypothetical protein
MNVWEAVTNWLAAPFRQEMDWLHVVLLVGLVLVAVLFWTRILSNLD